MRIQSNHIKLVYNNSHLFCSRYVKLSEFAYAMDCLNVRKGVQVRLVLIV